MICLYQCEMAAMDRDIPRSLHFHDSQFQPFLVLIRTCQFNLISKKHLANISMPFHCSHVILSNIEFAKQTDDITQTHTHTIGFAYTVE